MTEVHENSKKIKTYDFKRPDKFSRDQIKTLSMIHETFARLITSGMSAQLRSMCHVRVASVDQMTYEEFVRSIPNPTVISVIDMEPLRGSAVLEIDPSLYFTIIDRIFGGPGQLLEDLQREVTEIECGAALEGLTVNLLGALREAWSNVIDLRTRLSRIEVNPQFAQIVPPSDMVVLISLKSNINGVEGFINLCLPYITIEPIIHKLSGKYWFSSVRGLTEETSFKNVGNLKVDSQVVFEGESLSLNQLNSLERGSLIKIDGLNDGKATLLSGGNPVLTLELEMMNGEYKFNVLEKTRIKDWTLEGDSGKNIKTELIEMLKQPFDQLTNKFSEAINNLNQQISKVTEKQDELVDQISFGSTVSNEEEFETGILHRPFSLLENSDTAYVCNLLMKEHPQTIALILSYISADKASILLREMPIALQGEILKRITAIDRTDPEVIINIDKVLQKKLTAISSDEYSLVGGIGAAVDILNIYDRASERGVLDALEKDDPQLVESIKQRMFVFEDMILLDEKTIKTILDNCEKEDIVLALKSVNDQVKTKIYKTLAKEESKNIEDKLVKMGPVRMSLIEEAQFKIVNLIKQMEEKGEIYIARPDEEIVG